MILLDAYALVAFLGDEPVASEVEELLRRGGCGVSAVNLAEAADVSARVHARKLADTRPVVTMLVHAAQLEVLAATESVAWRAATLRATHYAKRTCEVSLADCFLLATAGPDDEIATSDPAVAAVARAEQLAVIGLDDSAGRRP